jgi:cytochrome b561
MADEDSIHRGVGGYGRGRRLFHWLTVAAIAVLLPVGIAMTGEGFGSWSDALYITHKGLGTILGVVLVARLLWRVVSPAPPPLPATVSALERRLARMTHAGLYVVLFAMVATGYLRTVMGGFPIEVLDIFGIPPLVAENPDWSRRLSVAHSFLGYLLVAMAAVHVGAVSRHGWVLRDGVFSRMWPPWGSNSGGS